MVALMGFQNYHSKVDKKHCKAVIAMLLIDILPVGKKRRSSR